MYYQEKISIMSLIGNILVSGLYFIYVYLNYDLQTKTMDFKFWASIILIFVLIQIITRIIIHIISAIIIKITDNEEIPTTSDEMDKLIELKSTRNSSGVLGIGVLLSMGLLLFGMQLVVMFYVILSSMFLAGVVSDISMLYFYRKGV
jgi:hypothetical protein